MSAAAPSAMLIESDSHVRDLMRAKLAASGISVTAERPHGIAAQQAIQEMQPQLIFVAIEQPIQRAMQVVDFARAQVPGAMIVAYSGSWSPTVERRLMQSGVNDFLHGKISREQMNNIAERARRKGAVVYAPASDAQDSGRVIAVVGQKGGIGKTTTSTNLAAAIAAEGSNTVLLIDLDTRFGDVAVMMDVKPDYTVSEIARDATYLDRDAFRSILLRHESGAFVLPAPRDYRSWLNCSTEQLQEMVRFAAGMFDVVILDTPGTFNDVVGAATELADRVVVVTSTDLTSLKNTSLLIEHLGLKGRSASEVVVTLIHGHDVAGAPSKADVEYAISHPVDYEVPFDRNVRKASQAGIPVVRYTPRTPAALALGQLAGDLGGFTFVPVQMDPVRGRFFKVFGSRKPAVANSTREDVAV
ncbi:MAG: AAA family ATPase [Dehalococcoidia bacterium]|nr:AAA family ATPase [Dehalococcoidia bacterium]